MKSKGFEMEQKLIITSTSKFIKSNIHIIRYTGEKLQKQWMLKNYSNILMRTFGNTEKNEIENLMVKYGSITAELRPNDFLIAGNYFVTVMSEKALLETFNLPKYQLKELGIK